MPEFNNDQNSLGDGGCFASEYAYQPLFSRQFRLLFIGEGISSEELRIIHASLDTAPPYTSVSYSWEDQQRDQDLRIEGCDLKVTTNLRNGLPHLMKNAKTRYLWIDTICIDQKNDKEKADQIPQMREIYKRCQECLVWLGEGTAETEIAFDAIPRMSQQVKIHGARAVWEREGIDVGYPDVLNSLLWKGLVDLFARPWFRRTWTFQECVLPDDIYFLCGIKVLGFSVIEPLAMPLLHHLTSLQLLFPGAELGKPRLYVGFLRITRIAEFKQLGNEPSKCLDTLRLLYFTRPWAASNRLDKIYGILGLADSSLKSQLAVDYNSTTAQLSQQIAQWYISFGNDLFILNLASSVRRGDDQLPSWIPNFPRLGSHWCIGVIWHRFRTGMTMIPVSTPFASVLSGGLHVHGFRADQVSQVVSYSAKPSSSRVEKCRDILEWEKSCLALSRTVFELMDDDVPAAHWMTLISGICDHHIEPSRANYDSLKCF
ncbi:hypothetical protein VTL71DRAFT_4689 [Oculimacula yallundae]|uniref:Heterokaryon incompatibility domain-containing protein n=1 Tax=Oculimacula yallundae TaxID=86028 RepID=A0ABR4C3H0_9HELO